ncbi:endonuclease [Hafnia phage Enc34]|uniref:VRR-NUC domain protein n=1 Tax=Hafnia phage Enc34 TaxID=1150990 RepID=H6WYG4_9CAUD|nr:endonuclease [Hafnia phage Enc34]AFB84022.1 VRR-NUC domain protein [Hafnia phage Enc34]
MPEVLIRESKVEKESCEYAMALGWWVSKYTAPGKKAVPDRLFIRDGIVVFVEFKRPTKVPTLQQVLRHKQMREKGANVFWVDNYEDFKKLIKSFM